MLKLDYIEKENPPRYTEALLGELSPQEAWQITHRIRDISSHEYPNVVSACKHERPYFIKYGLALNISQKTYCFNPKGTPGNIIIEPPKWDPRIFSIYGERLDLVKYLLKDLEDKGTRLDLLEQEQTPIYQ